MEEYTHLYNRRKKILFPALLNIIITIIGFIGGIILRSLSLISDAVHNFSNIVSLLLYYVGEKLSQREPDDFHTFSYKGVVEDNIDTDEIIKKSNNILKIWEKEDILI